MKMQSFVCERCGVTASRPLARGQRPKWCSNQCRNAKARVPIICEFCGETKQGWPRQRFCSRSCVDASRAKRPTIVKPPYDPRSAIRRAIEDEDCAAIIAAIKADTRIVDGCWVWTRRIRDGYPTVNVAGKSLAVHRLMLEAKHDASLGSQAAHHICANSTCVNPDHLQPVTHRDNVAEMLARQSYLARIRELEEALADLAPNHSLLSLVKVA